MEMEPEKHSPADYRKEKNSPWEKPFLPQLREHNLRRAKESFQTCSDWTIGDWGNALAGEVGELCNLLKKVRRGESGHEKDIEKEIADVLTYLDLIAAEFSVDLEKATRDKFNEVSLRVGYKEKL